MYSAMLTSLLLTSSALLTAAVPVPQTNFPGPPADTKYFLLKAQTLPGSPHPEFDGTYLESYHTGAGMNDVVFNTSKNAAVGFLNGTQAQFNLSGLANQYIPWTLDLPYEDYASMFCKTPDV